MKISIVKDFFEYYGQNNLTSFKNLDEEVQIRYSTLGEHRGREMSFAHCVQKESMEAGIP